MGHALLMMTAFMSLLVQQLPCAPCCPRTKAVLTPHTEASGSKQNSCQHAWGQSVSNAGCGGGGRADSGCRKGPRQVLRQKEQGGREEGRGQHAVGHPDPQRHPGGGGPQVQVQQCLCLCSFTKASSRSSALRMACLLPSTFQLHLMTPVLQQGAHGFHLECCLWRGTYDGVTAKSRALHVITLALLQRCCTPADSVAGCMHWM